MFAFVTLVVIALLFAAMMALQEVGRRMGARDHERSGGKKVEGGPAAGAVYGLLGLLVAFSFSGASSRYESRYRLIVEEANAIGTAWLRLDVLPSAAQPAIRDLMRRYTDMRIADSKGLRGGAVPAATAALQQQIWNAAVEGASLSGESPPWLVILPALNDMIDITSTRAAAAQLHPPVTVFVMLAGLSLVGALFAGYGTTANAAPTFHTMGFAFVLALALYVIVDFEFPRFGLIQMRSADSLLVDVRQSMK
jgi:hypothetical protein